jgi:hypothetical protein
MKDNTANCIIALALLATVVVVVKCGRVLYNKGVVEGYQRVSNLQCTESEVVGGYEDCVARQMERYHRLAHYFKSSKN